MYRLSQYQSKKFQGYPKQFPEDIEKVVVGPNPYYGSIYISNIEAANNLNTLKRLGIRAVLTAAKGYQVCHPRSFVPYYKYIPANDESSFNLTPYFDEAVDFIQDALPKANVLVHCIAGVSRSVALVIAYLIRQRGKTYQQAHKQLKMWRRIINPNNGFVRQLKEYELKQKRIHSKKEQDNNLKKTAQFSQYYKDSQTNTTKKPETYSKYRKIFQTEYLHNNRSQAQNAEKRYRHNKIFEPLNSGNLSKSVILRGKEKERNSKSLKKSMTIFNQEKDIQPMEIKKQQKIQGYKAGYSFNTQNSELNQRLQSIKKKYQEQKKDLEEKIGLIKGQYFPGETQQTIKKPAYHPYTPYEDRKRPFSAYFQPNYNPQKHTNSSNHYCQVHGYTKANEYLMKNNHASNSHYQFNNHNCNHYYDHNNHNYNRNYGCNHHNCNSPIINNHNCNQDNNSGYDRNNQEKHINRNWKNSSYSVTESKVKPYNYLNREGKFSYDTTSKEKNKNSKYIQLYSKNPVHSPF